MWQPEIGLHNESKGSLEKETGKSHRIKYRWVDWRFKTPSQSLVEACKQTNKQTNKASLFFLFQDHHQLEVIAPSSFYPSKLFVSFLIYIMSCSLLITPFIRFPSTLSSPTNIDITTTSYLYLIQQQVKKSLVFDTVTSITWASTQFSQLRNLCLQCHRFMFRISSAFTPFIRFRVLFHCPPISPAASSIRVSHFLCLSSVS